MPEYKRFVAYFYEYINGKKEKNAGFVKVELRNGMWRILFRLTTEPQPEQPVQVYGFVREKGYQLAIPFGLMRTGKPISEEWAYRTDYTFEKRKYSFADICGIRIQSGDHRNFITVWDDEPMELDKFVLELPEKIEQEVRDSTRMQVNPDEAEIYDRTRVEVKKEETENVGPKQMRETENLYAGQKEIGQAEKTASEQKQISAAEVEEAEKPDSVAAVGNECPELFAERQKITPFSDDEIKDCVQLMPCDIVRLQQENWNIGRSSFLQHGFYQYRHLLFGKFADGTYLIGVPGIQNQQEEYMAKMCGFEHFKAAKIYGCGKTFGYWWKTVEKNVKEF